MNKHMNPFRQTDALDEVLLDVAALIELSPRDRRVADNRYRLLKEHLERNGSPLAPYLIDGVSLIYAQGSIATSTTIVSGTEDDRFDVDAIVEIDVPARWNNDRALDLLEASLQGFPGVVKIIALHALRPASVRLHAYGRDHHGSQRPHGDRAGGRDFPLARQRRVVPRAVQPVGLQVVVPRQGRHRPGGILGNATPPP
jgi:hypothetical protein